MKRELILILILLIEGSYSYAQRVGSSPEYIKELTSQWKGPRLPDGRPHVPDLVLEKLKNATLEQVWGYMNNRGYRNQVAIDWVILKSGEPMTGRVVTAQFMPSRPDLDSLVRDKGKQEGRSQSGGINIWPIDILTKGDVYVANSHGKIKDGTLIGSSLGNSVYAKTGNGVVFEGSIRDMQELKDTEGFNAWIKGHHPSYIRDLTPTSINAPIKIGDVTVLPGDVLFANDYGVAFIPAHMVEGLVTNSELIGLRDEFERYLLRQNKYPSGQIHGDWSAEIKAEYRKWFLSNAKKTTVTIQQIDDYLVKMKD
ncbi:MAG: RraA family protein [Daejeonella sp.]|uniref:RraA family protein n=1 Tax=Daejeonella sp. TaxID=2805397 RepID=UPI0027332C9B|nr:RraA family protein [Daejeonella sp.]MDP3466686.1 RraA family protein [Daejeonella sp.]